MKLLLIISALVEAAAGVALFIIPTSAVSMLRRAVRHPGGLVAARIAGAALIALAIACWQTKNGERGSPSTGVVEAMLFYNFAAALLLAYAGIRLEIVVPCFGRRSFCMQSSAFGAC